MASSTGVPFLLVSGPPGVGKTTVCWEIHGRLIADGKYPALVDLDLLGANWPVPDDDPHNERMKARNLGAVWANFRRAGATHLIASGVIEGPELVRLYVDAVPSAEPMLCRLTADPDVLGSRIVGRGRERGDGSEKLVRRAIDLSTLLENDGADLRVDASNKTVEEVSTRILAYLEQRASRTRAGESRAVEADQEPGHTNA